MRLKSFTGQTMTEAMATIRQELGPDAIIVSTEDDPEGGMRVTVALDDIEPYVPSPRQTIDAIDIINEALADHGVSPVLIEKILAAALRFDEDDPLVALSGALAALYSFAPVENNERRRVLLLAGPPGAGKTVSIAKLAARTFMAGHRVRLVTADTTRAGGIVQLGAFAEILGLRLHTVDNAYALAPIAASVSADELLLIDSAGINPYSAGDRRELSALIAASDAEPLLVLPAGGDQLDTIDMARVFRDLGCRRLIVTRLDMVRRLGSILAVADEVQLGFAEAGVACDIAQGLAAFNPVVLARMLLPQSTAAPASLPIKRGMR